ncbi:hypothetical protein AGLY_008938, partial [Aphis glycines]
MGVLNLNALIGIIIHCIQKTILNGDENGNLNNWCMFQVSTTNKKILSRHANKNLWKIFLTYEKLCVKFSKNENLNNSKTLEEIKRNFEVLNQEGEIRMMFYTIRERYGKMFGNLLTHRQICQHRGKEKPPRKAFIEEIMRQADCKNYIAGKQFFVIMFLYNITALAVMENGDVKMR